MELMVGKIRSLIAIAQNEERPNIISEMGRDSYMKQLICGCEARTGNVTLIW